MLKNKSTPQAVPSLEGLFIEDIAVGCEHVLALSTTGDVYAWGWNSEGQVTSSDLQNTRRWENEGFSWFTQIYFTRVYFSLVWDTLIQWRSRHSSLPSRVKTFDRSLPAAATAQRGQPPLHRWKVQVQCYCVCAQKYSTINKNDSPVIVCCFHWQVALDCCSLAFPRLSLLSTTPWKTAALMSSACVSGCSTISLISCTNPGGYSIWTPRNRCVWPHHSCLNMNLYLLLGSFYFSL